MSYNKLVRDKIPEIIKNNGENPITKILSDKNYKLELERKLYEEYEEVIFASGDDRVEELADMLEVIESLAKIENKTFEELLEVKQQKVKKRGAFNNKIYLIGVEK